MNSVATTRSLVRPARAASVVVMTAVSLLGTLLPLSVPAAATPWGGSEPTPTNLTVFLHNSSAALPIVGGMFSTTVLTSTNDTASPWASEGRVDQGLHFLTVPFYLFPRLAGSLVIDGTPTANVYVNQTGSTTTGAWTLSLFSISPSGNLSLLGTPGKASYSSGFNGNLALPLSITYGSSLNVTLGAGWSLEASFSQSQGSTADWYGFWWGEVGGTYYPADLNLPASSYLSVESAFLVDTAGRTVTDLNTSGSARVVSLRANLTDPLGNYDFDNWSVNWSVASLSGVPEGGGPMYPIAPTVPPLSGGSYETYAAPFNYSNLPNGGYTLCVNATDNSYHNDLLFTGDYYGRSAEGCTSFVVGLGPNALLLTIEDDLGHPLDGAQVVLGGISNATGSAGVVRFGLLNGSYAGTVTWQAVQVATFTVDVSGPTSETIATAVVSPTLWIEDQASQPLSDALVYLIHPNGTHLPLILTNASARISLLQVPSGDWGVTVLWHDSIVYSQPQQPTVLVNSSGVYPILSQVYYQTFRVVESDGAPIPSASLIVQNSGTGVVIAFGVTNATGSTTARMPAGNFAVMVYWQDSLVATVSSLSVPASANPYTISASLYTVTLSTVDSQGQPVSGAIIAVTGPAGVLTNLLTDANGTVTALLPGGVYGLATVWDGVVVNSTVVQISASSHLTLELAVFYLTIQSVDSGGAALPGSFLQVRSTSTGALIASAVATSAPTSIRIPAGRYAVFGTYEATYDLTPIDQTVNASVDLTSSQTITLRFSQAHPSFTSTEEFYVVLGYGLLGTLLLALIVLTLRRRPRAPAPVPPKASTRTEGAGSPDPTAPGLTDAPLDLSTGPGP